MKIGLIGYGAMGRLVGQLAVAKGHEIALTIDIDEADRSLAELADLLQPTNVAIDFSIGDAVPKHAEASARAGVPLVVGTTGWQSHVDQVRSVVERHDGALVYGANFSVGVQVYNRLAGYAAALFRDLDSYDPFIEEAHHKRKRDAPSGTALQLHRIVSKQLDREVPVISTRAGYIPGTHRLGFDSAADQVTLTHTAR
ncbi:MAG TPA: dihydrodipicolinate reductase C-terminal domain-containing protein, partial [Pyrinomonadaceae bacterium]|nr:dihydrodipicolinate reductase C-terminal domain-containing protein [Pyrinomonadaceae bacterium]